MEKLPENLSDLGLAMSHQIQHQRQGLRGKKVAISTSLKLKCPVKDTVKRIKR